MAAWINRLSPFGEFCFNDQQFQAPRALCNPYFFTVVVAPKPGVLWESSGNLTGLHDQILDASSTDPSDFHLPQHRSSGHRADCSSGAIHAQPRNRFRNSARGRSIKVGSYINSLRLGDAVLYAQVLRILAEMPNVLNVQDLHLRRCPPRFGEIVCGPPARFGNDTNIAAIEAPCGGDIALAPTEVAVFAAGTLDSLMEVTFS